MKITKSRMVEIVLDLLERGYTRFKKDETEEEPGKSIQSNLSGLAGTNVSDVELKTILAWPEFKAKKSKVRVFEFIEEEVVEGPEGQSMNGMVPFDDDDENEGVHTTEGAFAERD